MRFSQLDRITALEIGKSLTAVKCLSLAEEYLQDHFPRFPVMPGVIMLESMFQTSMFLIRATTGFRHSTVVLREANSFKFQGFVEPGDQLVLTAELKSTSDSVSRLRVKGTVNGETVSSGRLVVDCYNLADREDVDSAIDSYMIRKFRLTFRQLCNQLENRELLEIAGLPGKSRSNNKPVAS